jgi:5'-3' exonuclease
MSRQIVIIDTFCLLHNISDDVGRLGIPPSRVNSYIKAQLLVAASCDFLGELKHENSTVIFSVDDKTVPYWRKVLYPEYKVGRSKAPQFSTVKSESLDALAKMPYPVLSVPSQESDDIIAAYARFKPDDVELMIVTIDSDLIGLVREYQPSTPTHNAIDGIGWFSMSDKWQPRLRNNLESINRWALKRHSILLEKPSDLWVFKSDVGDKADNLPAGTPIEMIDLFNPPARYDIASNTEFMDKLYETLKPRPLTVPHPQLTEAKQWLKRNGYRESIPMYRNQGLKLKPKN